MADKFTWVQTHKELAHYLKEKENEQRGLVALLRKTGVTAGLVDEKPKGNRFDLEEIDPFSFFCFIYKYGPDKRLQTLQNIATELDLHYPEDELGIPSAQAQKVMMFPFKHHREEDEIKRLWQFFYSVLDGSITNQKFDDVLNIYGVGIIKITEALFYVAPETYLPINGPTKLYLKEVLGIAPNFSTWQEYLDILNRVKEKTDKPFYEISHEARVWLEKQKNKDTKYKMVYNNPDDPKMGISQTDLYQVVAYAIRYKIDEVALFYPDTIQNYQNQASGFTIRDEFADQVNVRVTAYQLPVIHHDLFNNTPKNRRFYLKKVFEAKRDELRERLCNILGLLQ